jgi:hypothetical protein
MIFGNQPGMKRWGRVTAVLFRLKEGSRTSVTRNGVRGGVRPRLIEMEEKDSTRRLGDSKEEEEGAPRSHEDTKGEEWRNRQDAKTPRD